MRLSSATLIVLLLVGQAPPAAAAGSGSVGLLVTRSKSRRVRKKHVKRFAKALRRSLSNESDWRPTGAKDSARIFQTDKQRMTWRCRPDPVSGDPDPEDLSRTLFEDERFCAFEVAKEAELDRLLLVHVRWVSGAFHIDLHHLHVALGKLVSHAHQRVPGKKFSKVLTFASALARRGMKELGGFRLEANVEGADVDMDGMFLGRTPLEQDEMSPGVYELKITADGYFDWKGQAEVRPGEMNVVTVELRQPRMSAPPPGPLPDGGMKWLVAGVGGAAAIGGGLLFTSSDDAATRAAGIALGVAGVGAVAWAFTYDF